MTVFNTFWKIVNRYKGTVIMYTVILIIFGGLNMTSNDNSTSFQDSLPKVLVVNNDEAVGFTKNLVDYIENNSEQIEVSNNEDARNDALFYRDIDYIVYIPEGYHDNIDLEIKVKSNETYGASLAEMMLTRYLNTQKIYSKTNKSNEEIINLVNSNLEKKSNVYLVSTIDTNTLSRISSYFNFASYSIMAVIIYIVCLVISSFREKSVNKRIIVSSTNYKEHSAKILGASFLYSFAVWVLFMVLGLIIFRDSLINMRGLIFAINTLVFTFCALTLALCISSITSNKNAVSGIVNVIALGSAFLCGAFVPASWLPDSVLKIAHILPAYWYINSNDLLSTIETLSLETLKPILFNLGVIIIFAIIFIVINNIILKKKQKIG